MKKKKTLYFLSGTLYSKLQSTKSWSIGHVNVAMYFLFGTLFSKLQLTKSCAVGHVIITWNHFEMRLLNLRINFFFNFYLLRTFYPHLGSFSFVLFLLSPRYVSAKFHLCPSSGDLLRPRIGKPSLVTVSPVITAFHSCCLSHHIFFLTK